MKAVILYTMKGCPYCTMIKEELTNEGFDFIERDVDDYEDEYDEFVNLTDNDYLPSMILITLDDKDEPTNVKLLAPDRDFEDIYEGVKLVKDYMLD